MATEIASMEKMLFSTLSGDSTLSGLVGGRFAADMANEAMGFPLVLFAYLDGGDMRTGGGARGLTRAYYKAVAVLNGQDMTILKPIADRIDVLIDGVTITVDGLTFRVARDRPLKLVETLEDNRYVQLGGVYRVYA